MSDDKKISVQRTIDAPAEELFDILTLPANHAQIDGSGFVRSESKTDRITAVGQVFTMNMSGEHMGGDYQTDNHVNAYLHNKMVGWQTAPAGTEPKGWEWLWELEPDGPGATTVTLTYDWSKVTDKQLLQKVSFPLVKKHQLEESLEHLAAMVPGTGH